MNPQLTIYIDSWCPNCRRFGEWVKSRDKQKLIWTKDIREERDPRIELTRAVNQMASIDEKGNVHYGFMSICLIMRYLPYYKCLYPFLRSPLVFHLGNYLYDELAVRRRVIPLHCPEDRCTVP